jgi:membrane-bound ClpP family serine protease
MSISFKDIPARIYIRYGLLMIPGTVALVLILIVVHHWVAIPVWLGRIIVLLWIAKDVIMFPFVWRAYDWNPPDISRKMIGERGITKERLAPAGYIQIKGELWKAENIGDGPPIEKGEWVRVQKMDGLKLFVVPENREDNLRKTEDR